MSITGDSDRRSCSCVVARSAYLARNGCFLELKGSHSRAEPVLENGRECLIQPSPEYTRCVFIGTLSSAKLSLGEVEPRSTPTGDFLTGDRGTDIARDFIPGDIIARRVCEFVGQRNQSRQTHRGKLKIVEVCPP